MKVQGKWLTERCPYLVSMGAFLRLTRPLNLLIIAFTMVAMRYGVIGGNLERGIAAWSVQSGGTVDRSDLVLPRRLRHLRCP